MDGYLQEDTEMLLAPVIDRDTFSLSRSGSGYLAGEFPGGTTTVEGAPVSATVRVLLRTESGHAGDGMVVAETASAPDGTWRVDNLPLEFRYDVVGRKDGLNDVIVSNVTPTSMIEITYSGDITSNETFTRAVGFLELVGGIPPYSVAPETPLPSGLFPIVDGHKLIIDGTTEADEVASFDVKVTSSNGVEKIIPLQLVVGFKAPANFKAETVVVDDVFSVALTWEVTNSTQQIRVYRSVTPFDMDDLPEPIATLSGTSTTYTDDDVIEDDRFYYMVTAVCEQYELESEAVVALVTAGDPHWDNVVALLHFDGDLLDNAGKVTWLVQSGASFSENSVFGVGMSLSVPGINSLSASSNHHGLILSDGSDFTIEAWINITSTEGHKVVVGKASVGIQSYFLSIAGDKLSFNISTNGSGGNIRSFSTQESIPINTWCLIGVVKHNNDLHLFIDGELCATHTIPNTWYNTSQVATIGWHNVTGWNYPFKGFIDELRITKGVARYTENFTPPTKPFPNFGTSAPTLPTTIGEFFQGGYYIGDIEDQGQMYKVLVAPIEADVYGLRWNTSNSNTVGTGSLTDGWSNTQSMNNASHPAAMHCINYRGGGHDDWYMPAKNELNLFWLNIAPGKTQVPEFMTGGEQALDGSQYYWASTQYSSNLAWSQSFGDGIQYDYLKNFTNRRVRPVRRLPFTP